MIIIRKSDFLKMQESDVDLVKDSIFIYPTDTIYGIGCNAQNSELVAKLREIKGRPDIPFSVIVPSKKWILQNTVCEESWLDKLPGPYTFILKLRIPDCVAREVVAGGDSLGVRIPDHWFAKMIEELDIPLITTSVNLSGEPPIRNIDEIPEKIKKHVHFAIDEGTLDNAPSTIIDCTGPEPRTIER